MMSRAKTKNWISTAGVLFLLVVLPAGSWYYLRVGLNYRLAALEELGDYGQIPLFGDKLPAARPLREEEVKENMVITAFWGDGADAWTPDLGGVLSRLHRQFDKRDDVLLMIYVRQDSTEALQTLIAPFIKEFRLTDSLQCFFVSASPELIREKAVDSYQIPAEEISRSGSSPFLAFTDRQMIIRKNYDIREEEQLKSLVEHVAMLLPKKKEKDLVFRRETEK